MEYGNRGPRGCTKGENCELFHPKMCHKSLQDGICINPSCKFFHVRGTKRTQISIQIGEATNINYGGGNGYQSTQPPTRPIEKLDPYQAQIRTNSMYGKKNSNGQQNDSNQGYFLDALLQLKEEILKEMDKKLQQLRLPALPPPPIQQPPYSQIQQQQQTAPSQYYPQPPRAHMAYPMQRQMPYQTELNTGQIVIH